MLKKGSKGSRKRGGVGVVAEILSNRGSAGESVQGLPDVEHDASFQSSPVKSSPSKSIGDGIKRRVSMSFPSAFDAGNVNKAEIQRLNAVVEQLTLSLKLSDENLESVKMNQAKEEQIRGEIIAQSDAKVSSMQAERDNALMEIERLKEAMEEQESNKALLQTEHLSFEEQIEKLKSDALEKAGKVQNLTNQLHHRDEELATRSFDIQAKNEEVEQTKKAVEQMQRELQQAREELEQKHGEMQGMKTELTQKSEEVQNLAAQLTQKIEVEKKQKAESNKLAAQCAAFVAAMERNDIEGKQLKAELVSLKAKHQQVTDASVAAKDKFAAEGKKLKAELHTLKTGHQKLLDAHNAQEKDIARLTEVETNLKQSETAAQNLQSKLDERNVQFESLTRETSLTITSKDAEARHLNETLKEKQSEVEKLSRDMAAANAKMATAAAEAENARASHTQLQKQNEGTEKIKDELSSELQKSKESITDLESKYDDLLQRYNSLCDSSARSSAVADDLGRSKEQLLRRIGLLKADLQSMSQIRRERDAALNLVHKFEVQSCNSKARCNRLMEERLDRVEERDMILS